MVLFTESSIQIKTFANRVWHARNVISVQAERDSQVNIEVDVFISSKQREHCNASIVDPTPFVHLVQQYFLVTGKRQSEKSSWKLQIVHFVERTRICNKKNYERKFYEKKYQASILVLCSKGHLVYFVLKNASVAFSLPTPTDFKSRSCDNPSNILNSHNFSLLTRIYLDIEVFLALRFFFYLQLSHFFFQTRFASGFEYQCLIEIRLAFEKIELAFHWGSFRGNV